MAVMNIEKDFEQQVLRVSEPVVVDFWAPWCGYCRRLSPVIERLSAEYGEKVRFVKLNIDEDARVAERYQVDTIPTLILFRDGKSVSSVVNPESQDAVKTWLKENHV